MALSLPRLTLVLGGARSGKSRFAETWLMKAAPPWTYVATGEAGDAEMAARIMAHQARRGAGWATVEVPLALAEVITTTRGPLLIDCLTLWLSNQMWAGNSIEDETQRLLAALGTAAGPVVVVTNEVGLGIVPDNALARDFRDAQGRLNAQVAAAADHVVFIAAGLPLTLKQA